MVFMGTKGEIELEYTLGAFTKLKNTLKAKNLRKTMLVALNSQDYETMCKAVMGFTGGKVAKADEAFAMVDAYAKENAKSYYDVFIDFMAEIEEAGFFGDKMDTKALKAAAASPATIIDEGELLNEAMKKFKGGAVDVMINKILQDDTPIGASTSKNSELDSTSAE